MASKLVVVESPAKAKTISKFLGKGYTVKASMGHVRDLPVSKLGVDVENDYLPQYQISKGKKKVITELKSDLKKADELWIATDEDREGEAIGWHLVEALKAGKKPVYRIVFHEITKDAIQHSVKNPRDINQDLVDAQQARRVLDRLVGYGLSPLLWKKIRYGLSAGRVQSVAVRLVVEREREIQAFVPEEYWSVHALLETPRNDSFHAELQKINKKKFKSDNETDTKAVVDSIKKHVFEVEEVKKSKQKRNPAPPFTTSTLQQEAARKLGFSVKKTMMVAQQLYEGAGIEGVTGGLITYMRTDSVNLSDQAIASARGTIEKLYGEKYLPAEKRLYKSKKGAQEAHEAVRPVDFAKTPDSLSKHLNKDQLKLYSLIWKRALASQMVEAVFDKLAVTINSTDGTDSYQWGANGKKMNFDGFIRVYVEGKDEENGDDESWLPEIKEGEEHALKELLPKQHFTKPPARYTEASLVKTLEKEGIGRPSTYAPIISTIVERGYIVKEQKQLVPTDTAFVVTDMLVEHFSDVVDVTFTKRMEDELDEIADGKKKWVPTIDAFYKPFSKNLEVKKDTLGKQTVMEETDETCPDCGGKVVIKLGRYGKFKSCANYPECKFAEPLNKPEEIEIPDDKKTCKKCGADMVVKQGRYGAFLGCSAYPNCKNIVALNSTELDISCPKCKEGKIAEKRTKRGKIFYGCDAYPKCDFALWEKPVNEFCDKCGSIKTQKNNKTVHCSNKECSEY